MAFCKDCTQWRKSTSAPEDETVGVCQIDGREKEDIRYSCVFFSQKKAPVGTLDLSLQKD